MVESSSQKGHAGRERLCPGRAARIIGQQLTTRPTWRRGGGTSVGSARRTLAMGLMSVRRGPSQRGAHPASPPPLGGAAATGVGCG